MFRNRRNKAMKLVLAMCALAIGTAFAQTTPKVKRIDAPKHVLFVGNSFIYYNNSMHGHLREIVKAAGVTGEQGFLFKSMTISGGYLSELEGGLNFTLYQRKWDLVVLQGQSTEPMDGERAEKFRETARRYDKSIREAGSKTAFFMTWAYQNKPEMTAPLAEGYLKIGNELDALVVPVGLAFHAAIKERPALILHFTDKFHPSLPGTYLAANTFYAALYGKSPLGNPYRAGLDKDTAEFLQGIAWKTVKGFYGWE
jgi:hypothetical protein